MLENVCVSGNKQRLEADRSERRKEAMKRLGKRSLALAMAISMGVGMLPYTNRVKSVAATEEKLQEHGEFYRSIEKKQKSKYKEGQAIVMYRSNKKSAKQQFSVEGNKIKRIKACEFTDISVANAKGEKSKGFDYTVALVKSDTYSTKELIRELKKQKEVLYAQPNYVYHVDGARAYDKYLWGLDNQGQNAGEKDVDIQLDKMEPSKYDNKEEKVIAVVDTGIDYKHEDLRSVMWQNPYQNVIKGAHGYDFCNGDKNPMDGSGHGTHVAGVIAADAHNEIGVKGVAADTNVKLMALKVFDDEGNGDVFQAISAYNYIYKAQQLGVNVVAVNNSWGGILDYEYGDDVLERIINLVGEKGAVSVCAASNEGWNNDQDMAISPACLDSDYIVSVAAANEKGELAYFSNYGEKSVELAAPGTDILSTVPYDVFNPSLYEKEDVQRLCSYKKDFNEVFQPCKVEELATVPLSEDTFTYAVEKQGEGNGECIIEPTSEEYFGEGKEKNNSLHIQIKNASYGDVYNVYVPYDKKCSDTERYTSMMLLQKGPKLSNSGNDIVLFSDVEVTTESAITGFNGWEHYYNGMYVYDTDNYWTQIVDQTASKEKKDGRNVCVFSIYVLNEGECNLYLDDLAISKENAKASEFGQYEFMNGTSMAAPYVTGAVAVAKSLYPRESAKEIALRIAGSATKTEGLKGKVSSGGMLDLTRISKPNVVLTNATMKEKGTISLEGAFFGNEPKVVVNGSEVSAKVEEKGTLSIAGDYNTQYEVEVTVGDHTAKGTYFFPNGTESTQIGVTDNNWTEGNLVSTGDELFYVTTTGNVIKYYVDQEEMYVNAAEELGCSAEALPYLEECNYYNSFEVDSLFAEEGGNVSNYSLTSVTNATSLQKEIFTIVKLDLGYYSKSVLVAFDPARAVWNKVADIPKEFEEIYGAMLCGYNGKLYLMGGYHTGKGKSNVSMYSYQLEKESWKKEADMPKGVFSGEVLEAKDKMVVTLGGCGEETTKGNATNYIFDGSSWKTGATLDGIMEDTELSCVREYQEGMTSREELYVFPEEEYAIQILHRYTAAVGNTDQGLVYAGLRVNGIGNTFVYDVDKDAYGKQNVKYTTINEYDQVHGGTIGGTFYILSGLEVVMVEEDWFFEDFAKKKAAVSNTQEKCMRSDPSKEDYYYYSFNLLISAIGVKHTTVSVKQMEDYEEGLILGTGSYEVGEKARISAKAYRDCYVKQLYLNGKKVKNGYTFTVKNGKNVASAVFGKYVTNVRFNKKSVVEGNTIQLNPIVTPEDATDTAFTWKSSDISVATVDANGNVKAKAGSAGHTVFITATAKDRGEISGVCKVDIKAKVKATKVMLSAAKKSLKVGKSLKIKVKVTPGNATDKAVVWSTSNKKYATVSSKGKVTAKKAGKGHTVKITAKLKSNKKIKGTIKIKIK